MSGQEVIFPISFEVLAEGRDKFLRFLSACVADQGAAEDILQSAYVKAMESADNLRSSESIVAWFYRILRNSVIDYYRRNAARNTAYERLASEVPASYETELKDRVCACVGSVIQDLKPEYREAIEQVDLAEESVVAFAARTGISTNNAMVRLHRGRRALASRLAQVCGVCAEHKCIDCTCRHA